MKLSLIILSIFALSTLSNVSSTCSGYEGYIKTCSNSEDDWHESINTKYFDSESACQVLVKTKCKSSCSDYCASQGAICLAGQDNEKNTCNLNCDHDRQSTDNNGCDQVWKNQVCLCDKPDPCGDMNGYDKQCSNTVWHELVDTSVLDSPYACQVLVTTSYQTDCAGYCASQGKVCVAGQDNIDNTCSLDFNHEREPTTNNGCNQVWNNQVCVCDNA